MSRTSSSTSSAVFSFVYQVGLALIVFALLFKRLLQGRSPWKDKSYLEGRLGKELLHLSSDGRDLIWVHAASLGEVRAGAGLIRRLKEAYPEYQIVLSTLTAAGLAEGKKALPQIDAHFLLPLDFAWMIRPYVEALSPRLVLLVEGDFWYQFLSSVQARGGKVCVISGKISERSAKRYRAFAALAKKLLSPVSLFCLQSDRFYRRFRQIGIEEKRLCVTGNLKFDAAASLASPQELGSWRQALKIGKDAKILVIGSTHKKEEEELLTALSSTLQEIPSLKILIVPRHKERFDEVFTWLKTRPYPVGRYSQQEALTGEERVLLIDAMGVLTTCYQLGDLALVAGSFSSQIGGHNILEPIFYGIPTLFGPSMHTQLDMVELVEEAGAGLSVTSDTLSARVRGLLEDTLLCREISQKCWKFKQELSGTTEKTLTAIRTLLP